MAINDTNYPVIFNFPLLNNNSLTNQKSINLTSISGEQEVFLLKVSVIGASGRVGKTAAFCLAEENCVNDLVLISRKESIDKVEGEALDMYDALGS